MYMGIEGMEKFEKTPGASIDFEALKGVLPVLPTEGDISPDLVQTSLDALDKLPSSLRAAGRELLLERLDKSK